MQKKIIVSGAGGALGKAVVNKFRAENYYVAGIYHRRHDHEAVKVSAEFVFDLADAQAAEEEMEKMIKELGNVDVLACIAGGFGMNSIENATAADIKKAFDLNFFTAYNLVRPVFNHMKQQGHGRIFLTGSRQGLFPEIGAQALAYTLSKSLLFSLAKILNGDKDGNVIVTVIVPSTIDTEANRKSMPDADFKKWVSPASIADVMAFYASDKASAIRNPVIKVFNHA